MSKVLHNLSGAATLIRQPSEEGWMTELLADTDRAELATRSLQAHREVLQALHHQHRPGWLELDLTMSQVRAMIALSQRESMSIGTLAELLGIGISAASQLVERLVQQGLVERRED